MKLKAIRGHFAGGKLIAVGAVYEASDALASELIATGKAEPASDAPRAPRAKGPMTTKSTGALIQGGGTHHAQ
jgi:hypothetical protein